MTNTESKDLVVEGMKRDAERRSRLHGIILKESPDLDISALKEDGSLYGEYKLYLNNKEYIGCDGICVVRSKTDLGLHIKWAGDRGNAHEIVETEWRVFFLEEMTEGYVWYSAFFGNTGERIKGARSLKRVHRSTKGAYVILGNKRHYVNFLNK